MTILVTIHKKFILLHRIDMNRLKLDPFGIEGENTSRRGSFASTKFSTTIQELSNA